MVTKYLKISLFYIFLVLFLVLSLGCSASPVNPIKDILEDKFGEKLFLLKRVTVSDIVADHGDFGNLHQNWIKFRDSIKDGDELLYFETSKESWRKLRGAKGYVIVRGETIIDAILVSRN
jgi:hypothetical protein